MKSRILAAGLALSGAAGLIVAGAASAHTSVASTSPAHGSTVAKLPRTATITFSGPMVRVGAVKVTRNGRGNVARAAKLAPGNARRIVVTLKTVRPKAQRAVYRIVWNATGPDGHAQRGVVAFRVR